MWVGDNYFGEFSLSRTPTFDWGVAGWGSMQQTPLRYMFFDRD